MKEMYVRSQLADIGKIRNMLGFEPSVSLKDGIRVLAEHTKNLGPLTRDRRTQANAMPA